MMDTQVLKRYVTKGMLTLTVRKKLEVLRCSQESGILASPDPHGA